MGYNYENAWNDLKDILCEPKPDEESCTPLNNKMREWIRNEMSRIEKEITV